MRRKKKSLVSRFFKLIVILILIAGGFLVFDTYRNLKQVHQHSELVDAALEENGITEHRNLVLSIILTESKGLGLDPMQSSESAYGIPNVIQDPARSIEQGVAYFARVLREAEAQNTDIWTAVQAYNFGTPYIAFVAANGGVNTLELAEEYSRDVLAPHLGNTDQTRYRYINFHSLIYNGGFLYHNGGNIFYADLVRMNEWKIRKTSFLFN